jgi:hypothetical protein
MFASSLTRDIPNSVIISEDNSGYSRVASSEIFTSNELSLADSKKLFKNEIPSYVDSTVIELNFLSSVNSFSTSMYIC